MSHMEKILARKKHVMSSTSSMPKGAYGFITGFNIPKTPRPFSDEEFNEYMGDPSRQTDRELLKHTAALVDILGKESASVSDKEAASYLADYAISHVLGDSDDSETRILEYCRVIMGQNNKDTKP